MAVDITKDPRFTRSELTQAINVFPRQYGLLGDMEIFGQSATPIDTNFVSIVKNKGSLTLIPVKSRNGDTNKSTQDKAQKITIEVPHLPLDDSIEPEDLQNLEIYIANANNSTVDPIQNFQAKVNGKLQKMSRKHDITHEFYRAKALNGYIKDADDTTLVDLYTLFGLTRANFQTNIDLASAATDVSGALGDINEAITDKISDDTLGIVAFGTDVTSFGFASASFWKALLNNTKVREAYNFQQGVPNQNNPLRNDLRQSGFVYGGVWWFQYTAKATTPAGATLPFVPNDKAFIVPAGTQETFEEYAAPANYNDTVNTMGEEKYAKVVPRRNEKGADLETQSNRLALCKRPDTLWEVTNA